MWLVRSKIRYIYANGSDKATAIVGGIFFAKTRWEKSASEHTRTDVQ